MDMEHERMRFDTMSIRQLRTRLNRITNRWKLRNFIRAAWEKAREIENTNPTRVITIEAYKDLAEQARAKLEGRQWTEPRLEIPPEPREEEPVNFDDDDYLKRIGAK